MQRRSILQMSAGLGALSASTLSGCLDSVFGPTCSTDGTRYEWCFPGADRIDTVVDGTVYVRNQKGPRDEYQEVVALDAETGTVEWKHNTAESDRYYTALTVADGIYLPRCRGDQGLDCDALVALNMDGTERWTQELSVGYQRPFVVDGTVYVATAGGYVQAFNASSGEQRWEQQIQTQHHAISQIITVSDTLLVDSSSKFVALDRTDGNHRWEYETGNNRIKYAQLSDGIAYIATNDRIAAISDGKELWNTTFDRRTWKTAEGIVGITSTRVLLSVSVEDSIEVDNPPQLTGYDKATGDRSWTVDASGLRSESEAVTVVGDVAYLGGEKLVAVDANTGNEIWQRAIDDEFIRALTVIEEDVSTDHAVFVQGKSSTLALFSPGGEKIWSHSIEGPVRALASGKYVFVLKDQGIFALNRRDDSDLR